jgi:hypothetical protein
MMDDRVKILSKRIVDEHLMPFQTSILIENLIQIRIKEASAPYFDVETLKEANIDMYELIIKIHEMTTMIPIGANDED